MRLLPTAAPRLPCPRRFRRTGDVLGDFLLGNGSKVAKGEAPA
jgi:hypothetical protein